MPGTSIVLFRNAYGFWVADSTNAKKPTPKIKIYQR
jgi:hypothetical protein